MYSYVEWGFKLIEIKLTSWLWFQLKKCVIPLYKDEKGMPVKNFKIANAKNLTMELKKKKLLNWGISIHWDFTFTFVAGTQRYKKDFVEKKKKPGQ